jgi:hypothetical protein
MVNAIAKVPQVIEDRTHQIVIWPLAPVKSNHLLFQKVEESSEIDVVGMPYGKWVGHGALQANGSSTNRV